MLCHENFTNLKQSVLKALGRQQKDAGVGGHLAMVAVLLSKALGAKVRNLSSFWAVLWGWGGELLLTQVLSFFSMQHCVGNKSTVKTNAIEDAYFCWGESFCLGSGPEFCFRETNLKLVWCLDKMRTQAMNLSLAILQSAEATAIYNMYSLKYMCISVSDRLSYCLELSMRLRSLGSRLVPSETLLALEKIVVNCSPKFSRAGFLRTNFAINGGADAQTVASMSNSCKAAMELLQKADKAEFAKQREALTAIIKFSGLEAITVMAKLSDAFERIVLALLDHSATLHANDVVADLEAITKMLAAVATLCKVKGKCDADLSTAMTSLEECFRKGKALVALAEILVEIAAAYLTDAAAAIPLYAKAEGFLQDVGSRS
eukprot:6478180-Amphidinium_carterae.2